MSDVVSRSHEALRVHGRTFSLASTFLPAASRDDAAVLYALCRHIDDLADEAPDPVQARHDLEHLLVGLREGDSVDPLASAWLAIAERRHIPLYPLEALIQGVLTDTQDVRIPTDEALLLYCYQVAGTVGLLMCGVLDVEEPAALPLAVDLGIGMQLTNICRDVREDAERGRVYLPATRLAAANTSPEQVLDGSAPREALVAVVNDLLVEADARYARGEQGLVYLPMRCRFAIRAAARMYRSIGVRLRNHGSDPMQGRTVVPWHGKAVGLVDAFCRTLPLHDGVLA